MAEREYFSVRYLIPGSTFLLLILAYNIHPLYDLLRTSQVSVSLFGAILAVIGSPTIGFLISQFWWKWFQWKPIPWEIGGAKELADEISLKSDDKENKRNALIVYDYVLHSELHSREEMVGLSKYAFRRYDNYVLLSCTNLSLILGALLGIASRLLAHRLFVSFPAFSCEGREVWWLIIVSVATLILIALINYGKRRVEQEHRVMHEAIIKALIYDGEIDEDRLREIFPREYFKEKPKDKSQIWIV